MLNKYEMIINQQKCTRIIGENYIRQYNMNDYIRYAATISEDINDHISTRKVRI